MKATSSSGGLIPMVTPVSAQSVPKKSVFRLGVGGRWSPHDLETCLASILKPMGWSVCSREEACQNPGKSLPASEQTIGVLEILPLGDGLANDAVCKEDEELDAVIISPLFRGSNAGSDEQARVVRKHLARFVRQLKPGGATIFAADDPASDIFSSIRLDCQRLGYSLSGVTGAYRVVRADRPEPVNPAHFRLIGPAGDTDWPIPSETSDRWPLALAVLAAVDVLGLSSITKALGPLSVSINQATAALV
jgi:hypothetical protein